MKLYLLSVYQPDGDLPPELPQGDGTGSLGSVLAAAGAWPRRWVTPSTATVVRLQDGKMLITDGPFAEGKEHIGGFTIIKARDLDSALEWGRKFARAVTLPGGPGLPIEVRPFQGEAEG
jgi:hypothetical protein